MTKVIAKKFAQALHLAIGSDAKTLARAATELDQAALIFGHEKVQKILANPRTNTTIQSKLIAELLDAKTSKEIKNLVQLVLEKKLGNQISAIAETFQDLIHSGSSQKVKVSSAEELEKLAQTKLVTALKKALGVEIVLETKVEPGLLGGLRVQIGDDLIDLSLRGRLNRLATSLNAD